MKLTQRQRDELVNMGVQFDSNGRTAHVMPKGGTLKILDYKIYETTPIRVKVRQNRIRPRINSLFMGKPLKFEIGFLKDRIKECIKYIDPSILIKIIPIYVKDIYFNFSGLYVNGKIITNMENNSIDGQEGKTKIRPKRYAPCPKQDSAYVFSDVVGSSGIKPEWRHISIEENTRLRFVDVSENINNTVSKNNILQTTSYWKTYSIWDTLYNLLQYFVSGTITTTNGFDTTLKYYWKDEWYIKNIHIDTKIALPVTGILHITW